MVSSLRVKGMKGILSLKSILLVTVLLFNANTHALNLSVLVTTPEAEPIKNVVVELFHPDYLVTPSLLSSTTTEYEMIQQDGMFKPFVMALPVGAEASFPNFDKTRHHVYSFSPTKTFDLKLFSGEAHDPVLFDKSGIVAVGCNIHDYMQGYIYVSQSRFYGVTNEDGLVTFSGLPKEKFILKGWHPSQIQPMVEQEVELLKDNTKLYPVMQVFNDDLDAGESDFKSFY